MNSIGMMVKGKLEREKNERGKKERGEKESRRMERCGDGGKTERGK